MLREQRNQLDEAIVDLEAARTLEPDEILYREWLTEACKLRARELADSPEPQRNLDRAMALARRAVDLCPWKTSCLNTLGVVQYRSGLYAESITSLERSLEAGHGEADAFDLLFLTMAHYRLGQADVSHARLEQAVRWMSKYQNCVPRRAQELAGLRAEAEAVLAVGRDDLPDQVFANPR